MKLTHLFMCNRSLFIVIILTVLLCGCNRRSEIDKSEEVVCSDKTVDRAVSDITFTDEEKAYIETMKEKGVLKVACRNKKSTYELLNDGTIKGFHFNLVKSFAEYLVIGLEIRVVKWDDYFSVNGKVPHRAQTDKTYSYTPDLIKQVDLYMDTMTIMPWREKLLCFVKVLPSRILLLTRKDEEIQDIIELKNKTISMVFNTSYETRLRKIEKDLDYSFHIVEVSKTADMVKYVAEGKTDATFQDGHRVLNTLKQYKNLSISMPVSDTQFLAWAVKKDNRILASILDKYIKHLQDTGILNKYFNEEYNITMTEYFTILGCE